MCGVNCKSSLSDSERNELEEIRKKLQMYEEVFSIATLDEMWKMGWFSHKLASDTGDTSEETMEKLHKEDIQDLISMELDKLEKESYSGEIGED